MYEVLSPIGAGGMGEVYRARDTNLNRDVALKIMPESFACDPDRVARFKREAQVLASLNHPNIGAIYGFEDSNGTQALVLELVEGPTLADRIAQGPIPLDEALPIARQIAEALEAAHEQGIIHRDLKPANIKLRPDGTIKVLDFGLAKALIAEPSGSTSISGLSHSPTMWSPVGGTSVGVLLGTASYMSPEQARGKAVDKRADIWAFGCVLFEMLTAQRAFGHENVPDTIAHVLRAEPPWDVVPNGIPATIVRLLRRCLTKDLRQRTPDIAVARQEIDQTLATPISDPLSDVPVWRRGGLLAAVVIAVLLAITGTIWASRPLNRPESARRSVVARFSVRTGVGTQIAPGVGQPLAASVDGGFIAYNILEKGLNRVYIRRLNQLDNVPVRGTENAGSIFLSPDGEWIGFNDAGSLKKVGTNGGAVVTVTAEPRLSASFRGASWGANGQIVFSTGAAPGLMLVSENGGAVEPLTEPRDEVHVTPQFLEHGRAVLYVVRRRGQPDWIAALSLTQRTQQLVVEGSEPRVINGRLVFFRGGSLWMARFDPIALSTTSAPRMLPGAIESTVANRRMYDISPAGLLAYVPGTGAGAAQRGLAWIDRNGREQLLPVPLRAYAGPRVSPDGQRLAVQIEDSNIDTFIYDLYSNVLQRITFDAAVESRPVWSLDGNSLFYRSESQGPGVYVKPADGSGTDKKLITVEGDGSPNAMTPDGHQLLFTQVNPATGRDVWALKLSDGTASVLVNDPGAQGNPVVSPNGRWLAYHDEGAGGAINVRPFPDVNAGRWQVVSSDAKWPVWSRDGGQLFYQTGRSIRAVTVDKDGESFRWSASRLVFEGPFAGFGGITGPRNYDVAPDGRFLVVKSAADIEEREGEIVIVQNWLSELPDGDR
jgi:serine/threonine-protein kinase